MALPDGFRRVLLHLARSKDFPDGSARHGYEIVAPLDVDGHLDVDAWRGHRQACRVRRFWGGERDETGLLVHRPGGVGGSTWGFDYDSARGDDDEAGYRLGSHTFKAGEYVSIRDDEGDMHTFRVVTVDKIAH